MKATGYFLVLAFNMKTCVTCKIEKSVDDFGKRKSNVDGLRNTCKECRKLEYVRTRDKVLSYQKEYTKNNKDRISEYQKKYRDNNKETLSEKSANYYQNNKERIKQKSLNYYYNNLNSRKEAMRLWSHSHQEHLKDYNRQYRENNRESIRVVQQRYVLKKRGVTIGYVPNNVKEILRELQEDSCGICNTLVYELDVVNLDHIIPISRNGVHSMDNLQYTHESCNKQKGGKLPEECRVIMPYRY